MLVTTKWVAVFLGSAAAHLLSSGKVAITVVNSSHYDGAFDMDRAAERSGFARPVAYPFQFSDYPGYGYCERGKDRSKQEDFPDFS